MQGSSYFWLAGKEGMEKKMATTIQGLYEMETNMRGYMRTTIRIQFFIPSYYRNLNNYQYHFEVHLRYHKP